MAFDVTRYRMANQQIVQPRFTQPGEVVAWLGAVQAQDYLGALWAVGLRAPGATEQTIEQALADRTIVRTWPMRGTIHFVAAADARWMLELLTPRVVQRSKSRRAQLGIDETVMAASADIITTALQGGRQLTRPALYELLEQANIATGNSRGLHILGQLAHDQVLCFGARAGKQPTFTLLDEWVPCAKALPRDEALATLAARYFSGHGPATLQDFMWWSGLTTADARAGLHTAAPQLGREKIGGQEYYYAQDTPIPPAPSDAAFLLPPFDEYLVGYKDRSAAIDAADMARVNPGGNGIFSPIIVIQGRVVGLWKRVIKNNNVVMSWSAFESFSTADTSAITVAAQRYAAFVGKTMVVADS